MKISEFSMVTFFRTSPPIATSHSTTPLPSRSTKPFYHNSGPLKKQGSEVNNFDKFPQPTTFIKFNPATFGYIGPAYLFSAKIELHEVKETEGKMGVLKPGLRMIIKGINGEWYGTVIYDYLMDEDRVCIREEKGKTQLMSTIQPIEGTKYLVFVEYISGVKVAFGMELCPDDEKELDKILADYEDTVRWFPEQTTEDVTDDEFGDFLEA